MNLKLHFNRWAILSVLLLLIEKTGLAQGIYPAGHGRVTHVIANVQPDSVVLRWAVSDAAEWMRSTQSGFEVERGAWVNLTDSVAELRFEKLATIRPQPVDFWKKAHEADRQNANIAVAAQSLFGQNFQAENEPKPTDDPMTHVVAGQKELQNRWSFAMLAADFSAVAADGLGLRFVDKNKPKSGECFYRIRLLGENPDTAQVKIEDVEFLTFRSSPPMLATEGREKVVRIFWLSPLDGSTIWTGFFIEKQEKSTGPWQRLNEHPILSVEKKPGEFFEFTDSVATNYQKHNYRIIGITPFGELTEPSAPVAGMGVDKTPPAPPRIQKAISTAESFIKIDWETDGIEPDFSHFTIERSFEVDGPFEPISDEKLPANARFFIDKKPILLTATYYRIVATDTAGNRAASYSALAIVTDTLAPAKPMGLRGTVDSTGLVRLSWPLGPEPDIMGYRVFFVNQADHERTNLTPEPIRDTLFEHKISLATITKKIFFQIVAVDRHFNHSGPSDFFEIKRPDTIAPVRPIMVDCRVDSSGISLEWVQSSSDDVAGHQLLRCSDDDRTWKAIQDFSKKESRARDAAPPVGRVWYAIEAIDEAGNRSGYHPPIMVVVRRAEKPGAVAGFKLKILEETHDVQLTWQHPDAGGDAFFIIYRGEGDGPMEAWRSLDGTERAYLDRDPHRKKVYRYALSMKKRGGPESDQSPILTAQF